MAMVFVGLVAVRPAFAQMEQARVSGVVTDSTGGALPGVTVTVTSVKTAATRTAVTSAEGLYIINNLAASTYVIKAELSGFSPAEFKGVELRPGQEVKLDVKLGLGGVNEQVTVAALEGPAVDLSSARMGTNVISREITDLPVNGRQLSQLYLQAPGSVNTGTGTFGDIRFSGRAVQQNVIRYDGIEGSAIIDASPGNLNGEVPSPFRLQSSLENVQEFRVESSNYPAEYGTGTGGQVSVVTKSGSNAVHGSVFEYARNQRFDSPNYFDLTGKAPLKQHQYGGSISGPIVRNKTFFFLSAEAYRLDAGVNFVEAVPSAAAWARAVPAVKVLQPAFLAPNAVILPGASANADFDIAQLQSVSTVRETAVNVRLDQKFNSKWTLFGRFFSDNGKNDSPEGVTGRVVQIRARPVNGVATLQGVLNDRTINEFRIGYNGANTDVNGVAGVVPGLDLNAVTLNLSGSVANTGIAGQGASSGIAIPGGLVRQNSATNGRGAPYRPYSLSIVDALSWTHGTHSIKMGGEIRMIRMKTDRLGGTTYTYSNLNAFLANTIQSIQYLGDLSEASVFNDGATGMRDARQQYYVGYAQDEWHASRSATINFGVRYDYYTPLRDRRDLAVLFNINDGTLKPKGTAPYQTSKANFQPRVSFTVNPGSGKTILRGGFGLFVGPGQTEDQIQPIESDRISITTTTGLYPIDPGVLRSNFASNPLNRTYQPRAYANEYKVPERVYQYTMSMQRELPTGIVATVAYVGSQGRNLFLRSVSNRITQVRTNANPASNAVVIREFDIVNADGSIQRPYAEVDYKTSGGHDSYNALQTQLVRRYNSGLTLNFQYTLAKSYGNTAGSNEALTAANNARTLADFEYDNGYNNFDVRHMANISALYSLPIGQGRAIGGDWTGVKQAMLGGWDLGMILNARGGLPVNVLVTRPDVVYVNGAGQVFGSPAAGLTAVINTPGGGASRNVRRPDLVPGVDPYIKIGTDFFLNPAAFAIPAPGTFGNLKRNSIRGPGFQQVDLVLNKKFMVGGKGAEFRAEVFNLFDRVNFANPVGTLPNALGTGTNQIQPGQPFTAAAAGTFGKLTSTVGRTVGLGTARQVQFAVRVNF